MPLWTALIAPFPLLFMSFQHLQMVLACSHNYQPNLLILSFLPALCYAEIEYFRTGSIHFWGAPSLNSHEE